MLRLDMWFISFIYHTSYWLVEAWAEWQIGARMAGWQLEGVELVGRVQNSCICLQAGWDEDNDLAWVETGVRVEVE